MNRILSALSIAAVATASFVSGCASTNAADSTSESMSATAKRLNNGITQVDSVVASLNAIIAGKGGDLKPLFKSFSDEVTNVEKAAANARESAEAMRAKATEQFEKWAKEAQNISDTDLKQANIVRRDEARAAFAKIQDARDRGKVSYDTFVTGLRDVRTFLGTDLTSRGVDSITPKAGQIAAEGEKLKAAMREIEKAISDFRAQIVNEVPPPAPAK